MNNKNTIIVNDSEFPLIKVHYPEMIGKEEIDNLIVQLRSLFDRAKRENKHIATVADVRSMPVKSVPLKTVDYLFSSLDAIDKKYPGAAVCDAVIATDPLVSLLVSTKNFLRTNRNHITRCFKTSQDAVTWAHLTLKDGKR